MDKAEEIKNRFYKIADKFPGLRDLTDNQANGLIEMFLEVIHSLDERHEAENKSLKDEVERLRKENESIATRYFAATKLIVDRDKELSGSREQISSLKKQLEEKEKDFDDFMRAVLESIKKRLNLKTKSNGD